MTDLIFRDEQQVAKIADLERQVISLINGGSFEQVMQVKDQAAAFAKLLDRYGTVSDGGCRMQAAVARCTRELGQRLLAMPKAKNRHSRDVTLTELGIDSCAASRWQRIAMIPEDEFESYVAMKLKACEPCTQAELLKIAKKQTKRKKCADAAASHDDGGCVVDDLYALVDSGRKFSQIYADPPWKYGNQGTRAATDNHYSTMTIDELCELPVRELAAENAQLHMWTTNGFLFECPKIFEFWGFEFKSAFVWCKPQMGLGNYWRVGHEYLLTATRGSATFKSKSLVSWGEFKRGKHSAKPQQIRHMIEQAFDGPRLELFAREQVAGWTVWGNQVSRQMLLEVRND